MNHYTKQNNDPELIDNLMNGLSEKIKAHLVLGSQEQSNFHSTFKEFIKEFLTQIIKKNEPQMTTSVNIMNELANSYRENAILSSNMYQKNQKAMHE